MNKPTWPKGKVLIEGVGGVANTDGKKFTSTNSAIVSCPICRPGKRCEIGFDLLCNTDKCSIQRHRSPLA